MAHSSPKHIITRSISVRKKYINAIGYFFGLILIYLLIIYIIFVKHFLSYLEIV
jgi:hypothetical protein